MGLLTKLFGSHSEKAIRQITPVVDKIEALADRYAAMPEDELKSQTAIFKKRLANGEDLEDILPEAFAVVREASRRVIGLYHYRVQLIGGVVLHQGRIAEMKTGEGKTLVATLPVYLNALTGNGVHVVTVNDYLAARDSEWMGKIYKYLGLSVGLIVHGLDNDARRAAYAADVTYGTNNELGFDYLRDNMVTYKEMMVQRKLSFAIVDEVDSILIDEARTPLIISGMGEESSDLYEKADKFVRRLSVVKVTETDDKQDFDEIKEDADYIIDEKAKTAILTTRGVRKAEEYFKITNLADQENYQINHHINNALKAQGIMHRDQDYVLKDGEVIIVDDFTGRLMMGRRYSNGLHQAIEAKEGVKVEKENKTLATITFQNFFRMYQKLSGMTGTALTEENEFRTIYNLDVVSIPTNMPMIRLDEPDSVYKTQQGKYTALLREVQSAHSQGQPILIGTISVEKSEKLSSLFRKNGIPHNVLNAKQHDKEAEIVAQAGRFGGVTIATNMAGRGTDIKLSPEVRKAGGLAIVGTERHESRRVDRQLRGRAGRQGDPGSSVFFISLEDDLMRLFGSDRIAPLMDKLGLQDDEMIENSFITKRIEQAQKKVEENHFGVRKRLLEYDDVMNKQRTVVYEKRRHALMGERIDMDIANMIWDRCSVIAENCADYNTLQMEIFRVLAIELPFTADEYDNIKADELPDILFSAAMDNFKRKCDRMAFIVNPVIKKVYEEHADRYENILIPITDGQKVYQIPCNLKEAYESESKSVVTAFQKAILLHTVDDCWKENLRELDELKHSVQTASYEQKDPLLIFKLESVNLFDNMVYKMNDQAVSILMRGQIPEPDPDSVREAPPQNRQQRRQYTENRTDLSDPNQRAAAARDTRQQIREPVRVEKTPGRNDPCPCGSGKKFKNCHGRNV